MCFHVQNVKGFVSVFIPYSEKHICKQKSVQSLQIALLTVCLRILYTPVKSYVVKQLQEKWVCDFHDDAPPLSFQLQVTEDFF